MEDYDKIKKVLAIGFMNFLDENRPEGKMCLSNGECADVEKAFNEQDWPKLVRYLNKYRESDDERMYARVTERYTRIEKYYLRALGETEANKVLKECEEEELWIKNLLEKQKEQKPLSTEETELNSIAFLEQMGYTCIPPGKEQKPVEWSDNFEEAVANLIEKAKQGKCDSLSATEEAFKLLAIAKYGKVNQQEWSEEDETIIDCAVEVVEKAGLPSLATSLKSLRPQPKEEIYQATKHNLAIRFMNYLDENRPEGKMSLSNRECEDIDIAFKENDWTKILKYAEKYGK